MAPKKFVKWYRVFTYGSACLMGVAFLVGVIVFELDFFTVAFPAAIIIAIANVVFILFWKCPHCKKRLPMRFVSGVNGWVEDIDDTVKYCPSCKENINQ